MLKPGKNKSWKVLPQSDFIESTSHFGKVGKGMGETISMDVSFNKQNKTKHSSFNHLIKISLKEATQKMIYLPCALVLSRTAIKAM